MKDYYTIGETAKLLGVSAQALRYYDRENILRPEYINEQTGYRYYTYRQFHIIDRIKYFQSFGLSLEEIGEIIRQGTAEHLLTRLTARKEVLLEQINQSVEQIKDIDWYINYFTFCVLTLNGKSGRSNICYLIKCNDIIGYYSIDGRRCDRCYTFSILATTFAGALCGGGPV